MNETILLKKKEKGKIVHTACEFTFLTAKDEREACNFYEMIANSIGDSEIFVPDNSLPTDLAGDGIVLGVREENNLICIRVLTFNQDIISEYKGILGEKYTKNAACSDGCAVDSRFRGNNLQLLSWFRIEPLLYGKRDHVVATVSPRNPVSLKNLFASGFIIIARASMYGGHERFILVKKLANNQAVKTAGHLEINLHDRGRMADALSEGYVGYKLRHRAAGINILLGQEII